MTRLLPLKIVLMDGFSLENAYEDEQKDRKFVNNIIMKVLQQPHTHIPVHAW